MFLRVRKRLTNEKIMGQQNDCHHSPNDSDTNTSVSSTLVVYVHTIEFEAMKH